MKIKVDVNNVTIIEKSDIHKGEYNINKCIFEFSSEYTKDLIYRAVFSCINGSFYQLILNNECNIPEEILREKDVNIELGVYAYILNDDNELELRYSPKPTYFRVENGSYKDADKTEVPSPTDYEKFLNEFNRNATNKTEEFNKNADEKIKEINNKVSDVEKIEDNIEEIEKRVSASEQNAKTSETNAKTSESNAQKSAKKASESESNIISIEKNINDLKKDIDNTKTQIDEKAKEVKNNSDIAIEQARIATQQATLSGQNANKTSVDKEDISQMKVSIEASEDNIEEIEKNVQAIKDDIEAAKNETLEAKEEVENSLENERIENDKKYARALKTKVEDVEQTQIYAENPEVENLVIKGAELTQKTREGYNFLKYPYANTTQSKNGIDFTDNGDGSITMNGTATDLANFACQFTNKVPNDSNYTFIIFNLPTDCYANCYSIGPKYGEEVGVYNYLLNPDKTEINLGLEIRVPSGVTVDNITIYPMLVKGKYTRENIPSWEQYGASPSLDYPSEVEITKEQKISIFRKNILDTSKLTKDGTNLAVSFEPKSDGGIKIYGTANNTWVSFRKQSLNVPIKQGTTIYSNYGKTEELMRDNNDIRPFFWFYDKDDKIMNANLYGSDFEVLPKDVYSIQFGIEHFNNGTTYDEDMYIELEISDKRPTQFQKYEVTDLSIALENGFNGALKDYYNEIKLIDGKWYLVNKFAHYVLDGTSSGNKVTAKQSKNNIDKYDVMLGTDKIYIDTSKDYWKPLLGICNYLKSDKTYGTISDINSTYPDAIGFWKSGQDQMSFSTEKDRFASIDEANAYLKQLYDAGKPLEFYVLMSEDNYETIELPEDIQKELDKFKLYDDLNNIFIDNGTLSFKYNKSLSKELEEKDEMIDNLLTRVQALEAAQVNSVGGN